MHETVQLSSVNRLISQFVLAKTISHKTFHIQWKLLNRNASGAGVSCPNYKYGSGISNLLKYFLIYLANQINRINMTSMDNIISNKSEHRVQQVIDYTKLKEK